MYRLLSSYEYITVVDHWPFDGSWLVLSSEMLRKIYASQRRIEIWITELNIRTLFLHSID